MQSSKMLVQVIFALEARARFRMNAVGIAAEVFLSLAVLGAPRRSDLAISRMSVDWRCEWHKGSRFRCFLLSILCRSLNCDSGWTRTETRSGNDPTGLPMIYDR